MHSSRLVSSVIFAAFIGFVQLSSAQIAEVSAHFKITQLSVDWRIHADATSTQEGFIEMEAHSESGAQGIGKYSLRANKDLQKFEILEAYTLKADSQKLPVGKDGVVIQDGVTATGTDASWPQAQIYQITFPNVQKGDKTFVRTRITTHTTQLPNLNTLAAWMTPSNTYDKVTYRIEAPRSLNLQVFTSGYVTQQSEIGSNTVWQIEGSNKARAISVNPINLNVTYPRIYVSTFKDNAQLAEAYAKQANAKAIVSDEVKALSEKIIEGKTTSIDKAKAIHDWMRRNIRYVAVYLGTGGWVPHDLDWILKNRYGDCKDHVLLMQTMLKAIGIEAVPALINTTNEYELAELPIGFNHAIIYIPTLNVFVDPTDSRIPFGALPFVDADKPVAVALNEGSKVMRTPAFAPDANRVMVKSKWAIAKSGKATGSIDIEAYGFAATVLQDRIAQIPSGFGGSAVSRILASSNLRGRGFTQFTKVQRDTQTQNFKLVDLEIDNFINDPQAGAINPQPRLNLPVYVINQLTNYTPVSRDYAFICTPLFAREEFEVTYDPAFQLSNLPSNFKETHPDGIRFEALYAVEGNTIKGWREYSLTQSKHRCSKEEYASRRAVMGKITLHLNRPMLFQQSL